MKNIAILVLAAGKSSRMKSIKQLEKINNKTLLEITLENAKKVTSSNIYCVLGANTDKIKQEISVKNIVFIFNKNYENGLSSSIISGINYLKKNQLNFDGVLILLADQPAIETEYLNSLLDLFQQNNDKIIASKYEHFFGVPAIFPKKHFKDLLLIKNDKGAKELINNHKNEVFYPKIKTNFIDIDTKEDLFLYKKSILK
ncbi:nucleotidyltransferase family protein [uncultured Polaribacter sp.]|uniref:nucleotidyltransferase family protein n=1 Tax=uncultured Polaribacter sp. TaxID=174711 RepID=UPI002619B890|nr:nucleotidyltransferase family protein [uncultured Polaribacter sp.]